MATSTSGVTGAPVAGAGSPSTVTRNDPGGQMGQDLFLKLLVTQLQYQDPLEPTDSKDMMAQLAQFSSVEGLNNVNAQLTALGIQQDFTSSLAMIGHKVTYTGSDGKPATGLVQAVVPDGKGTILKLEGGVQVRSGDVLQVQ